MCVCVCVCVCARAHVHVVWECVHISLTELMLKHYQQEREAGCDVAGRLFDDVVTLSHENTCEGEVLPIISTSEWQEIIHDILHCIQMCSAAHAPNHPCS